MTERRVMGARVPWPAVLGAAFALAAAGCQQPAAPPPTMEQAHETAKQAESEKAAPADSASPPPAESSADTETAAASAPAPSPSSSETPEPAVSASPDLRPPAENPPGQATAPVPAPPPRETIRILAPTGHFPGWLAESLRDELDAEIKVTTYDRLAQALDALRDSTTAYDVALLPDRGLQALAAEDQLDEVPRLEPAVLPEAVFTGHVFDRDNKHGWPYAFSLAAFAYRPEAFKSPLRGWQDVFRPDVITNAWMIGDKPLAYALMQRAKQPASDSLLPRAWPDEERGKRSPAPAAAPAPPPVPGAPPASSAAETTATDELQTAAPSEAAPGPAAETETAPPPAAEPGTSQNQENAAAPAPPPAPAYSGRPLRLASVAELKRELVFEPGWVITVPGSGSIIYLYHVALPSRSAHKEEALKILKKFLDPSVAAKVTGESYLGATQKAARQLQPPQIQQDALIYPDKNLLDHCTFVGQEP